mmetsp:Transcript_1843/g.3311  ORF Transcript_1843/g.3311 Transcript_1843/m.3311 type:complete len:177 (+) Transcript_1843:65-595(+)
MGQSCSPACSSCLINLQHAVSRMYIQNQRQRVTRVETPHSEISELATPDVTPVRSESSRKWGKLRASVVTATVMDSVLNQVRSEQAEKLYDSDWTVAHSEHAASDAECSEVGHEDAASAISALTMTPVRSESSQKWGKVRAMVATSTAMESVLNKVRFEQTEKLYNSDWTIVHCVG